MNQAVDIRSSVHQEETGTISITKSGIPVELEISEITGLKWNPPILTIVRFDTILMDFKAADAEWAYEELSRAGIPTDSSLGLPPF